MLAREDCLIASQQFLLDNCLLIRCGFRLTCFTCFTKGTCLAVVFCLCGVFVCGFWLLLFGFLCVCCFPLLLACLSSFTDWCIVHRQQSREQKKTLIVLEPKADDDLCVVSVEVTANTNLLTTPPEVEHQVDPPVGDVVPHVPVFRGEEEDDTEPDLDAIAASFADDQPDLPHAGSVHAESIVDQEVSRIQPNTQNVYLDCPRLGGPQLFSESAEHVLTAPKVGNRHQVYGPTLAPAMQSQVQIARGVTVGVHT